MAILHLAVRPDSFHLALHLGIAGVVRGRHGYDERVRLSSILENRALEKLRVYSAIIGNTARKHRKRREGDVARQRR